MKKTLIILCALLLTANFCGAKVVKLTECGYSIDLVKGWALMDGEKQIKSGIYNGTNAVFNNNKGGGPFSIAMPVFQNTPYGDWNTFLDLLTFNAGKFITMFVSENQYQVADVKLNVIKSGDVEINYKIVKLKKDGQKFEMLIGAMKTPKNIYRIVYYPVQPPDFENNQYKKKMKDVEKMLKSIKPLE